MLSRSVPVRLDLGVSSKVYPVAMTLTVSKLASTVGLTADAVRYYERIGLLSSPPRSAAGYRLYDEDAVGRLRFVKGAQRLGLKLSEIRELLGIRDQGLCPCGHADGLLHKRIDELDDEIARLTELRDELAQMLGERAGRRGAKAGGEAQCVEQLFQIEGVKT